MSKVLWQLSACELADGIRRRDYSCAEVMTSVLDRIDARNGALNALVSVDTSGAMAAARAADTQVSAGKELGQLHGIPVTIKDNIDVEGQPTSNGLPAFKDLIAPADSPVVRNLKMAGAIVVGRTNTPELSMRGTTDNPLHGRTFNPWAPDASPGGSSGGAGAAAAAGMGPIHHGNDIGGSLRFPSFCCGVATVKSTLGRVPAFNPSAVAERGLLAQLTATQGAICREVADVRLATRVMAAEDARDPWWVPAPFDWPKSAARPTVAFTKETYGYPVHPDILKALDTAAGYLKDAGYDVVEMETPSIMDAARGWFDVLVSEIDHTLGPVAAEHGSEAINSIFGYYKTLGQPVDADGYRDGVALRTKQTRAWNEFLGETPLILSPFLMRPTYPWDYDLRSEAQCHDLFQASIYSTGINYMSLPAGVLPMGFVDDLPAGVQLIGKRFREDLILDAMEVIQARTGLLTDQLWAREEAI
ncbi:MAG: amidase [Chromatiales bacterium]|jgi:amidase|nr:amidase [Chromatiales bacterium]